ncbi:DUF4102 domain-containing protein [Bradyrhizobium yuanmingense]|uniref:tyrosine-type recombinase/integrase n=1 Tax=Bradyrhizobium yuanmingense TaxID=108015 RepID=UPI000FE4289F|nr:integrase arm-type DNA-binding domain-containing protein [Bradyrhizobium yuanmingense]TGN89936.1 DUF4102 domain-containing protein [Bradyrhizobium yuanmingense]
MKFRKALSDRGVLNAKAESKDLKLADGGGLFLLVTTKGAKLWRYKFRLNGQERLMSLGSYPAISLQRARELHIAACGLVQQGQDPVAMRRAEQAVQRAAKPFGEVADEWLAFKEKTTPADKTADRRARMVRYLKSGFGDEQVGDLRVRHLSELLAKYETAGKYETRVRLQGTAIEIMGFAVGRSYVEINPFVGVNFTAAFTSPNETRAKRPAIVDPAAFGTLLRKIEFYEGRNDNIVGYALRLLALMFPRPGELGEAQWAHFDLDGAKWSVPFAELKQRTERKKNDKRVDEPFEVPLSRQAIALLRELHKITGHTRFLFPGRGKSRTISENTLNTALQALGYAGVHCAHGFRSSASTLLNKERVDGRRRFERELIEVQLDHVDDSTRAIYDRDNLWRERTELMQFWADKIDQLRASNVVAIKAA